MIEFTSRLQEQLENDLLKIEQEASGVLQQAEKSILVLQEKVQELRQYILQYEFENEAEEISFFKEILPKIYSRLIFYLRMFQIETRRPASCKELQRKLLQNELKKASKFFLYNLEFYQYYNSGSTFLDTEYFLRGKYDLQLVLDEFSMLIDPQFCTTHSYKIAKIIAYEAFQSYLNQSLAELDQKQELLKDTEMSRTKPVWTASKTDLIELIYAFYTSGALNHGNIGLRKIATFFEIVFETKLGNYSRVLQQMRIRKKNRASFLDRLRERLIQHMDDLDDNYFEAA